MKYYLHYLIFIFFLVLSLSFFEPLKSLLSYRTISILIVLISFIKILFFAFVAVKNLALRSNQDMSFHYFLGLVALHILFIVFSFSIDYYLVFQTNHFAFDGIDAKIDNIKLLFKMFYLSFMLFTNMGVANVVPVSVTAECITMFEAIVSFSTIIFVLSDFVSVQKSLQMIKKKPE